MSNKKKRKKIKYIIGIVTCIAVVAASLTNVAEWLFPNPLWWLSRDSTNGAYYTQITQPQPSPIITTPTSPVEPLQRIVTIRYDVGDGYFPYTNSFTVPIDNDGYVEFSHPWWEPTDKGLQFAGWRRENNQNYGIHLAGQPFRINLGNSTENSVLTFFAEMMPMDLAFIDSLGRVTVHYDSNGGSDPPSPQSMIKNSVGAVQLRHPRDVPTRIGYRFIGWQVHGDASSDITVAGQFVAVPMGNPTVDDVLIFRPQWERFN